MCIVHFKCTHVLWVSPKMVNNVMPYRQYKVMLSHTHLCIVWQWYMYNDVIGRRRIHDNKISAPQFFVRSSRIEISGVTLFPIHSFIHNYKVSLNSRETLTKNSLIALNNIVEFVSLLYQILWIICLCTQCTRISASCHRFCTSSYLMHTSNKTPANTQK